MRPSAAALFLILGGPALHAAGPEPEAVPVELVETLPQAPSARAGEDRRPPTIPGGAEEIRLRADRQETPEPGHLHATGFVDVQAGDLRIQSDVLDFYQSDKPDGTRQNRMVATGNVVFLRGDERLAGDKLEMDLDSTFLVLENASGYLQPEVYVEAKRIERLGQSTYRIEGGRFTSCAQPNPRWGFTASSATIAIDDKIKASNVFFKIKSVPALYIPYFVYPIQEDQRSSGLLFPHIGYSSTRGFNIGTGAFWAMGRSADQTLYVDRYSELGWGFGHELRWLRDQPSRGTFKTYVFRVEGAEEPWDYDLDWNALQMLPGRFRATAMVREYSNLQFQQQFQDNFNMATTRTRRTSLAVQGQLKGNNVQFVADSTDTFFDDVTRVTRRLPSLRVSRSQKKLGRSQFALGFEARAEYLGRDYFEENLYHSRFDLAPELSRSFSTTYLQVTPRIQPRVTYYGKTMDDDGYPLGPSYTRPFLETSVELRGPQFSRVFEGGLGSYTDKIKHVIGPEVVWRYRTRVDPLDFERIPKFDGYDQFLGTHQVDYALVQALYAKRPGRTGKPAAYQFLTWRLQQTYYVQINENQNNFDPNYSTSAWGPGGVPDHNSPILSRLRFRPTPGIYTNFDVEWDINFNQLRSFSLGGGVRGGRAALDANWSRAKQLAVEVEDQVKTRDFLRGSARLAPTRWLTLDGSADWDILQKQILQTSLRAHLGVQCCGLTVEYIRYDYNGRQERQFRFSVDLANLGSIGNFMGEDAVPGRQGMGGFN